MCEQCHTCVHACAQELAWRVWEGRRQRACGALWCLSQANECSQRLCVRQNHLESLTKWCLDSILTCRFSSSSDSSVPPGLRNCRLEQGLAQSLCRGPGKHFRSRGPYGLRCHGSLLHCGVKAFTTTREPSSVAALHQKFTYKKTDGGPDLTQGLQVAVF